MEGSSLSTRLDGNHHVLLAPEDREAAAESARLLHQVLESSSGGPASLCLVMEEPVRKRIALPAAAARLLAEMLAELSTGSAVRLLPLRAELSTQQAADILGVSRPYIVGLLEQGHIPHRRVGNRRRVPVADLLRYRRDQDERARAAVAALTAEAEELAMGYDDLAPDPTP